MTGAPLLALSREVLAVRGDRLAGVWPRASALLARQAVEGAVSSVLAVRAPGSESVSARAQLLCLAEFVPTTLARRTAFLWSVLSSACHHHPYDLAPTVGELQGWIEEAEDVVGRLGSLTGEKRAPS